MTNATPGGLEPARDVPNYAEPQGPNRSSGGTNHGTSGTQGPNSPNHPNEGGSPVPWINGR